MSFDLLFCTTGALDLSPVAVERSLQEVPGIASEREKLQEVIFFLLRSEF
jgi:hypothetical protein